MKTSEHMLKQINELHNEAQEIGHVTLMMFLKVLNILRYIVIECKDSTNKEYE